MAIFFYSRSLPQSKDSMAIKQFVLSVYFMSELAIAALTENRWNNLDFFVHSSLHTFKAFQLSLTDQIRSRMTPPNPVMYTLCTWDFSHKGHSPIPEKEQEKQSSLVIARFSTWKKKKKANLSYQGHGHGHGHIATPN